MLREVIEKELSFKAVRSSGAGGQNVNKVSSKVVLSWDCMNSQGVSDEERTLLLERLKNRFNKDGVLILDADNTRSQIKNKDIVIERFFQLLAIGLHIEKERRETKTPRRVIQKRKENKQQNSLKKALRKRVL
ncbi:aminoacyl-tRNA hydrolase [Myroides marinus]|uniref:alternative ribosome rescue aminoacyl-tRNA hydrolase ArfB n=1 Tax=Myroides marinus TaxID=703342 RepID=UPI002575FC78|nr:alternative ribosome rescue aminoacyl-tRNA hydrolase ArfB [Myroides marinus]MDM1367717.1 aminoacyl-tRNA hydrolase [Myroides marinus]MDM1373444.1 aminoacyl-tRNA hydrolase [Myroides marinus]MDM1375937.1 aminoacyl-tRNA hydrolase [Myroides marinus]MDM1382406.1 aminoacyl-tRNA hydrolase [Myroides marinus]MDM1389717.1 aminoacyl-tRNA hydrolase [Myroides marinus]